ncbi:hypothetical protein AAK964_03435 [Tissierella praeacuta]|uniref:hypothetical protein n=1 Tax=Tissierella praeacuta TaxID=43131 RepID=UPI003516CB19
MRNSIKELELEIALIKLDIREQEIVIKKYEKKVGREKLREQEKLLEYASLEEVQEAYGAGDISDEEYMRICDYFEDVQEKTTNEMFLEYLRKEKKQNFKDLKYLEQKLFDEELVEIARN